MLKETPENPRKKERKSSTKTCVTKRKDRKQSRLVTLGEDADFDTDFSPVHPNEKAFYTPLTALSNKLSLEEQKFKAISDELSTIIHMVQKDALNKCDGKLIEVYDEVHVTDTCNSENEDEDEIQEPRRENQMNLENNHFCQGTAGSILDENSEKKGIYFNLRDKL